EWNDYNLRWNDTDYGGVKDLRITPNKLWKPDVLMYNSADEGFDGTFQTNVVVKHNGSCLYVPPGIFKSTCKIDITWFPFDDQHCDMKFGSWTYDGNQISSLVYKHLEFRGNTLEFRRSNWNSHEVLWNYMEFPRIPMEFPSIPMEFPGISIEFP
ncbi:hypothetical protein NQ317_006209, partial [Molorchus minor]